MERTKLNGNISTPRQAGKLFKDIYYIARASYPNLKNAEFFQEYPLGKDPKNLEVPCITYGISRKDPDPNKTKPRIMEEINDGEVEGHSITRSSIRYTAAIHFDVWAASNEMADMLAEEIEELILTFQGAFNGSGLYDMKYKGLESKAEDWKDQVAHRRVKYDIGLEKILESSTKTIDEIIKKINATQEIIKEDD
jgi:hypothetical protein